MTNTESTERFVAANLCTEKVYGFIPDYWALVDTECHNKRRAHGKREEMQFLADGLNAHHKAERSSANSNERCAWIRDEDSSDFDTECGRTFELLDGCLEDNNMKYCCFCGKKTEEKVREYE